MDDSVEIVRSTQLNVWISASLVLLSPVRRYESSIGTISWERWYPSHAHTV